MRKGHPERLLLILITPSEVQDRAAGTEEASAQGADALPHHCMPGDQPWAYPLICRTSRRQPESTRRLQLCHRIIASRKFGAYFSKRAIACGRKFASVA